MELFTVINTPYNIAIQFIMKEIIEFYEGKNSILIIPAISHDDQNLAN
jgi:hypothetical protein